MTNKIKNHYINQLNNDSFFHPKDLFDRIDKQVINNRDLAHRVNLFEIIESDYDTTVRFYSPKIYVFSYKNYGTSFVITPAMKKNMYKAIINVFTTNEDVLRMKKSDLDCLYNIKESYFDEKSSEDAFTLGKELLKNIFDKTRDKLLG